jgi:phage shock protein A
VIEEQASLILKLLREMRAELGDVRSDVRQIRADFATKSDLSALRTDVVSDTHSLRAGLAADLLSTRKDLSEQIEGLRQTVRDYHAMALRVCPSLRRVSASIAASTDGRMGS